MKCTYKITINGSEKLFNSDQELDNFLANQYQKVDKNTTIDPTLQIDPIQTTVDTVNNITKRVKDLSVKTIIVNEDGDSKKVDIIPNSVGATKFITDWGNPEDFSKPLVTPFNKEKYLEIRREELKQKGIENHEVDVMLDNMQKSWSQLTDYGTEVHELFESLINKEKQYTRKNLTQDQVDYLTIEFENLINDLKKKHGENAQFFTEVPIISDKIQEYYQQAGITSINGRIDLLVIDSRGYANIYDFKVSRKSIGIFEDTRNIDPTTWHSTKKLSAGYQQAIYKAILNQYGITVGETAIIPIKINPVYAEDQTIQKLNSISIEKDSIKSRPFTTREWENITKVLPIKTLMDNVDLIKTIQEPMSKFVPNYEVETEVQRNEVTVENYIKRDSIVHLVPEKDKEKGKYWVWNKYKKNKQVYCKDNDELRVAVTELVHDENEHRGNELSDLAEMVQMAIEGYITLDDFSMDNTHKTDYCKRIFRKYIEGGWKFQNNPDYIAAGIFVFTKNGLLEVVSLHHNPTHSVVNLGKGDSILGATKTNSEVNEHEVLKATNGNIDLVKVMSLLNGMTEELKPYTINKIVSYNIWEQQGTETYPETLFDNFSRLCKIHNINLNLTEDKFASTLESTVNEIREVCGENLVKHIGDWELTFSPNDIVEGTFFLQKKMEELYALKDAEGLRRAISTGEWNFDDPYQLSYMLLGRALNKLKNYTIYIEKDPAPWLQTKGKIHTGTFLNSPGLSPSLNIQTLSKIFSVAETHSRRKQIKLNSSISKGLLDYYKYKRRNSLIGGEVKLFDILFRRDADSKINSSYKLRTLEDPSLTREEKAMIKLFLDLKEKLIYKGNIEVIERAKADDSYYEVPIAMGSTQTLIHNKGFIKAIKADIDENLNFLRLLPEQETLQTNFSKRQKVYNKYRIDSNTRQTLLSKYSIDSFETNLEKLMRDMIYSCVHEEVMNEYLPQIQAIKIALQYQQAMFGNVSKNSIEFIDKFITRNIYGKPIMDEQLHFAYKTLATIKNITTASTLGFNWRSGFRELLQSVWVNMTRVMANAYGQDMYTKRDLLKAWTFITKDSLNDQNKVLLVNILNAEYGLANADPRMIQSRMSASKLGVKNMNSDMLYIPNRVPDMYSRLGILIAKMMHDGCFEAHIVENDELIYDFKKDKRFSLLNDPNTNKNSEAYRQQHALYIAMLSQFNIEGWTLQDGDPLPRAYTIQEATSIKSFSELCFGHYDEATQMMMKHMFLGAMWSHFKTYLSAKLEQWILKPGVYNQGEWKIKYDDNGEMYVRIYTYDENGMPSARVALKSEVSENDIWEPYKEWTGRPMEGILYSILSLGKAIKSLNYRQLREVWKDPVKRSNLKLALLDLIWMSIMMMIVRALFNEVKETGNYGPGSHFLESAWYNSFSDGNIVAVLSSMSDMNPPSFSILSNIWDQTTAVITGDKNVWDAACNSFGALNDLKYYSQQLE